MTEKVRFWERLPEWARWILLLPAVVLFATVARIIFLYALRWASPGPGWGWVARWWGNLIIPACVGSMYGPAVMVAATMLAPRKQRGVGWVAYLLFVALNVAALVDIGFAFVSEDVFWQTVVEAVAAIIAATATFRELLAQMKRESTAKPKTP